MSAHEITHRRALAYLILAALCWSTTGIFIKSISISPIAIVGVRSLLACFVFLFFLGNARFTWSRLQISSAVAMASAILCAVISIQMTTAANAVVLIYTGPIYIALLGGPILGEPPTRFDLCLVAIMVFGMVLLFADNLEMQYFWGNVFGALGGLLSAIYIMLLRKQREESPMNSVFLAHALSAPLAFAIFWEPSVSANEYLMLAGIGVFATGIPFALLSIAITRVSALHCELLSMLEVPLLPLWVYLLLGETIGLVAFVGATLVLCAGIAYVVRAEHDTSSQACSSSLP